MKSEIIYYYCNYLIKNIYNFDIRLSYFLNTCNCLILRHEIVGLSKCTDGVLSI